MEQEFKDLTEILKKQGYFLQNFMKRVTEEEIDYAEKSISGSEFELEKIMTPGKTYNDRQYNVTYEELAQGYEARP